MDRERREKLRKRFSIGRKPSINDGLELMDALDEADFRNIELGTLYLKYQSIAKETAAECDKWKARADALERALKFDADACQVCVTGLNQCGNCHEASLFSFDEARFREAAAP